MARIISIVNQKGGTGKSACTANLAVGLAQKNMKVLIVDADPQSDVSAGFGYRDCDDSNETLTALMDAVMKDEDIPSDCYIRHQAEGIDIICSNIGLAGTEVQLVNAMSREYVLKQILYGIKDQYDIKNHLIAIEKLALSKEYVRLRDYIHQLTDEKGVLQVTTISGNALIDGLLADKFDVARKYEIAVEYHIEIPTKLPFDDADLCIIVGNALDNAIDGTKDIEGAKKI